MALTSKFPVSLVHERITRMRQRPPTEERFRAVDEKVAEMPKLGDVSLAIERADGSFRHVFTTGPLDPNSRFASGSVTKLFTHAIIFRLIDADMYWHFRKGDENEMVHRGIALHKMIRLVTAAAINGGYLNFMGNEFGHPEWIDFPREGNGWSYKYARRQWNLVDNHDLCYHYLGDFDREMLRVLKSEKAFNLTPVQEVWHNDGDQVLCFERGKLVFVFNFSPTRSFTDYGFLVPEGSYRVVLNTDAKEFGGNGFADDSVEHLTNYDPLYAKDHKGWLKLYIPARSAVVLMKQTKK